MNQLEESTALRALPMEEALRYATSLAELLRQMHRDGTVCGSLDPRCIAWDNHSVNQLVALDGGSSPAYRAPEQVRGEAADVRSDIFASSARFFMRRWRAAKLSRRRIPKSSTGRSWSGLPPPIDGIPEGISSLLRGCLEKERGPPLAAHEFHPQRVETGERHGPPGPLGSQRGGWQADDAGIGLCGTAANYSAAGANPGGDAG